MKPARASSLLLSCATALALDGCAAWRASQAPPQELLADTNPRLIRVTLEDDRRFMLTDPVIRDDSISGYAGDIDHSKTFLAHHAGEFPRDTFALADVRGIEVKHFEAGNTMALVLGIATTAWLIVGIAVAATWSMGPSQ